MSDDFSFTVDTRAVSAKLTAALANVGPFRKQCLSDLMLDGERHTRDNLVPVKDGYLQGAITGRVNDAGDEGILRTEGIGYAAAQEVHDEYYHPDSGPTGERGAHYIERGILYIADNAPEHVGKTMQRILEG